MPHIQVEGRLLGVYLGSKQLVVDEALEEALFGDGTLWPAAPLPTGLRDSALELLHCLVQVRHV